MLRMIYTVLLYSLAPLIMAWLLRGARRCGSSRYFRERRGRYASSLARPPLWLHCASVGEVRTAAPLVHKIAARRPHLPLLITTATATGAETAERILPSGAQHAYLPFDWPGAVRRFLRAFRPLGAAILETEVWPNLYAATAQQKIPLLLVNARLSERSVNGPALVRRLQSGALAHADAVLARSDQDAQRFRILGVPSARLQVLGSLKMAPPAQPMPDALDLGRPTVVAASTHDDEELRIARAWRAARSSNLQVPPLLVVVPRHPERGPAIRNVLRQAGFSTALRSAGEDVRNASVYVADTLGELERFMAATTLVIIGGSLIRHGGQNLLEPARLRRPILFGPYMSNFVEESERLLAAGGAQRFLDEPDLSHAIGELARDPAARRQLADQAAATVQAAHDTAELYADAILKRLEATMEPSGL